MWEGLGYYSRVRHLHAAAKQIVEQFNGELPDTREALTTLPGFGPYTIHAVLSFGFQKRALAMDGNVLRVLARYFLIEENVGRSSVRRKIEQLGEQLLDAKKPWVSAEGLIELGALLCLPKPKCEDCPLQSRCLAFQQHKAEVLPIKNEEKPIQILKRTVFVIQYQEWVLVQKGLQGRVMADLYEFPYVERTEGSAEDQARKFYGGALQRVKPLKQRMHTFTRYKAYLFPLCLQAVQQREIAGYEWRRASELEALPFSSGHRKIADELLTVAVKR